MNDKTLMSATLVATAPRLVTKLAARLSASGARVSAAQRSSGFIRLTVSLSSSRGKVDAGRWSRPPVYEDLLRSLRGDAVAALAAAPPLPIDIKRQDLSFISLVRTRRVT
jgi:hypothetical protein